MFNDIIYDFDGTLSDSYPVMTRALKLTLHQFDIEEDYNLLYTYLKVNFGYAFSHFDIPKKELHDAFYQNYIPLALETQMPVEGAVDICKYASEKGKRNYIFTHSGPFVNDLIKKWGMDRYITFAITSEITLPRKPDPAGIYYILGKYSLAKKECLMVGDRDIDIDSAKAAGISGCLFDTMGFYKKAESDFRISSLDELKSII